MSCCFLAVHTGLYAFRSDQRTEVTALRHQHELPVEWLAHGDSLVSIPESAPPFKKW